MSKLREHLPLQLHLVVFARILKLAAEKKPLKGQSVAVDSTTLAADAAMKSIVRRDNGEDWKLCVTRLMQEEGVVAEDRQPTDEEIRRYDKSRKNKKVSNEEWVSPTGPDSRIARMKDGTTHSAYKAERLLPVSFNYPRTRPHARVEMQLLADGAAASVVEDRRRNLPPPARIPG